MAAELGLNCVIHQRDALEDTIAQLAPFAGRVRGVFHCFAIISPYHQIFFIELTELISGQQAYPMRQY